MSVKAVEEMFEEVGVRRWGELIERRIHPKFIYLAMEEGLIRRPVMSRSLGPVPGMLVSAEANVDGMRDAAIAMLLTHGEGTVHGPTAGKLLRLTDALPRTLHLLMPHRISRLPRQVTFETKRCRHPEELDHEVDDHETDLGIRVRVTSPARTVADLVQAGRTDADAYRFGMTALSRFLTSGGEPGEVLRVTRILHPDGYDYASSLTDSASEAMASRRLDDDEHEHEVMAP